MIPVVIILSLFIFFYLGGMFLDTAQQSYLAWGLFFVLLILKRTERVNGLQGRLVFLLIVSFISVRYWIWRTTETLFYTGLFDFIFMMLLYGAETYSLIIHFLGMFVNVWPLERKPVPLPGEAERLPTVDIFIPTYTEPEDIVRVTAMACTQIDYPAERMRIHILDDGSTRARRENPRTAAAARARHESLQALARDLGVHYITREQNEHAKAGNINHALQHTGGELILFLDCDHVPARDILKNTVGHFLADPKLFVVQTPHFFINPDPVEKNLATFLDAPGENVMFYGAIQKGLDFWNTSYFCGSAGLLRRKYLEEIGGFQGESITEDAETSVSLHARGYNSAYVARPMICGLSPETFDSMILQRSRWAQGMIQIFILKNPFFIKGLTLHQRLCYANSSFFWFFGFARFIFYLAPTAFLLFGLKVYNASAVQVLAYAIPHVFAVFLVTDFLYGKVRWPFFGEIYESVQSFFLIPAALSAIVNPRGPTFKVTPKGGNLMKDFLSPLAGPFYVMFFMILATFPAAAIRWYTDPLHRDVIAICAAWSFLNLLFSLACLGVIWETRQVRRHHRAWAQGDVTLTFPRLNRTLEGRIENLSLSGIGTRFRVPRDMAVVQGEEVRLEARDSRGETYGLSANLVRVERRGDDIQGGFEFIVPDREASLRIVRFVYGDSQRWVDFWEKKGERRGMVRELLYVIMKGLVGCRRNLAGAGYQALVTLKEYGVLVVERLIAWQKNWRKERGRVRA